MADFCKDCSIELFGEDHGDLAGISIKENEAEDLYPIVICEGCGIIEVNTEGVCQGCDIHTSRM
jgi:hypothetical protein